MSATTPASSLPSPEWEDFEESWRPPSFGRVAWRALRRKPGRLLGLGILVLYIWMAVFGPMLYPHNLPVNPGNTYAPPSLAHPLGTDFEGTDVLALIITGSRYVLLSAGLAAFCTVGIGTVLGLVSGYLRGFGESMIMRLADFFLTVPGFPLLVVLSTVWNFGSPWAMGLVLGLTGWAPLARAVRSQTLTLRERGFVEAARGLGLSRSEIIWNEVFPNVAPFVAMHFLLAITNSIYLQVGLFFLGVVPFSSNNWGVMLNLAFSQAGAMYSTHALLYLLSPLFCIMLLTFGIVLFLGAVDEMMNPRLRSV